MLRLAVGMLLSGLIFASGPCMASCGPMLVFNISGSRRNIRRAFIFYSLFSAARIAVYLGLALGVYFLGAAAEAYLFPGYASLLGGSFVALCGVVIIFYQKVKLPLVKRLETFFTGDSIKNPLLFGLIYGLIPCAPFLSLLSYSSLVSHNWSQALLYAFCFGLGTYFSPLLLVSLSSGALSDLLAKVREKHCWALNLVFGAAMIFLGVQLAMRGL